MALKLQFRLLLIPWARAPKKMSVSISRILVKIVITTTIIKPKAKMWKLMYKIKIHLIKVSQRNYLEEVQIIGNLIKV